MRKARFKDDDGADHGSSEEGVTVAVNPLAAPRDDGAAVGETHHAARTDTNTNGDGEDVIVPYLFTERMVNPVADDHIAMIMFDSLDPSRFREVDREDLIQ